MDFYVVLGKAGARVGRRRARTNRVGKFQRVTKDEAKKWFTEKMGGNILNWDVTFANLIRWLRRKTFRGEQMTDTTFWSVTLDNRSHHKIAITSWRPPPLAANHLPTHCV